MKKAAKVEPKKVAPAMPPRRAPAAKKSVKSSGRQNNLGKFLHPKKGAK